MSTEEHQITAMRFDYSDLDPEIAQEAQLTAERIRGRLKKSVFDTGEDLLLMKSKIKRGTFGQWIAAEFGMTWRTANNYMNAAKCKTKLEMVSDLPTTTIYQLAAPSAPPAVVEEVLAAHKAGTPMSDQQIKTKLAVAITTERLAKKAAPRRPDPTKKSTESRARCQERQHAEMRARADEWERQRVARLEPLAQRLNDALGDAESASLVQALGDCRETVTLRRLLDGARTPKPAP